MMIQFIADSLSPLLEDGAVSPTMIGVIIAITNISLLFVWISMFVSLYMHTGIDQKNK